MSAGRDLKYGMTKYEKLIVSAYTGILMTGIDEFHKWVEEYLEYPVWTADFAQSEFWDDLRDKVRDEFLEICRRENDERQTADGAE